MGAHKVSRIVGWVLLGIAALAALAAVLGLAVMYLWNWLVPELFGLPALGFWEAVGLLVLCHLLFKSHHGGHDDGHDGHSRHPGAVFAQKVRSRIHGGAGRDAATQPQPSHQPGSPMQ
jgi:hypothetical protein